MTTPASDQVKVYGTFQPNELEDINSSNSSESQDFRENGGEKLLKANRFEFDEFLRTNLSELGPYQIFIICMLIIPGCFLSAFSSLDIVFMSFTPNFYCNPNEFESNATVFDDQCHYAIVYQNGTVNESVTRDCANWTYDKKYFDETLVTEWNLVCDKAIVIRTIVSLINISIFVSAIYTIVQDRFGRKIAFVLNLSVYLLGSCTSLWAPNIIVFGVLKTIGGISCMWNICFCWSLEFVGPSKRTAVSVTLSFIYALANMSLVVVAYFSPTWRHLGFMTSFPFILLYSYMFFVPESPRWLLTQKRVEESLNIFKRMASWQNVTLDVDQIRRDIISSQQTKSYEFDDVYNEIGFVKFFRSKNLLMKNILLTLAVILTNQLYVAVPFNVENFETNYFVAYILQASVEPPAILINLLFLNRVGRVLPLGASMIFSGVACIVSWPLEATGAWGTLAATVVSRFLICVGVPITQQLGNELYPTVARGTGNSVTLIATAGLSLTTQYILYTSNILTALPMLIMGSLTLIGGVLVLFLPETKNKPLPDSIEDAEQQGSVGWSNFKSHFRCAS